jgi:uncharacterized protein DUF6665
MPRFENPSDSLFAAEAAAALGHSGRKLRKALDALIQFDQSPSSYATRTRDEFVAEAAEAFWSYVVQREQFGLMDQDYIAAEYAVPDEVQRAMGPNVRAQTSRP